MLKEGDQAPTFTLESNSGDLISLKDYRKKNCHSLLLSQGPHFRLYSASMRFSRLLC